MQSKKYELYDRCTYCTILSITLLAKLFGLTTNIDSAKCNKRNKRLLVVIYAVISAYRK